jgi:hypothetical protein
MLTSYLKKEKEPTIFTKFQLQIISIEPFQVFKEPRVHEIRQSCQTRSAKCGLTQDWYFAILN